MQNAMPTGPRWYVISLRPRGMHAPLREAAVRAGFGFIALSPLRIVRLDDDATRGALDAALTCECVLFTSPAAVHAARASLGARPLPAGMQAIAAGSATAAALRRAGVRDVQFPKRMDSEGVLELPALRTIASHAVGLVTAPGGRGVIETVLQERGARVVRADVYRREICAISVAARRRLAALDEPIALLLSSGEALDALLAQLEPAETQRLSACVVIASSERLATLARLRGFDRVRIAAGPRPRDLIGELNRNAS